LDLLHLFSKSEGNQKEGKKRGVTGGPQSSRTGMSRLSRRGNAASFASAPLGKGRQSGEKKGEKKRGRAIMEGERRKKEKRLMPGLSRILPKEKKPRKMGNRKIGENKLIYLEGKGGGGEICYISSSYG